MFQIELKRQREARGLSQQALSDLLNVSQGAVGLWESGKRKPDLETLIRIAKLFDVSTDSLLGISESSIANLQLFAEPKQPDTAQNPLQEEMNAIFSSLPEEEKEKAMDYIRYLSQIRRKEST